MAARPNSSGINWQLLAKLCGAAAIVGGVLMFGPALKCSARAIANSDAPLVASENAQLDAVRIVGGEGGLVRRLGASVKACSERWPPRAAPMWQQASAGFGFLGFVLFTALGRVEYRRRVKQAAARQRQARASARRERPSRPSRVSGGEEGFDPVPRGNTSGGYGLGIRETSGPSAVVDDSFDPLAALDAEATRQGTPVDGRPVAPGPTPVPGGVQPISEGTGSAPKHAAPGRVPASNGAAALGGAGAPMADRTQVLSGGAAADGVAAHRGAAAGGALVGFPEAPETTVRESSGQLPSLDDLADRHSDGWDTANGWDTLRDAQARQPSGPATAPTDAVTGTMPAMPARAPAQAEAAFDEPQETVILGAGAPNGVSTDGFGGTGGMLRQIVFLHPVQVGRDFAVELEGTGLAESPASVQLAIGVETLSGETVPVWGIGRTLATAGRMTAAQNGVSVSIAWREVSDAVLAVSRREGDSALRLVLTATCGEQTTRAHAPILDRLVADFRTLSGVAIGPRSVVLRTVSGRTIRGWVGAERQGRLSVEDLEPGLISIEFEDGNFVGHQGGGLHRAVHVTTNGVAYSTSDDPGERESHNLTAIEPAVVYASTYASGTAPTGERDAPFPSIRAALDFALSNRALGDPAFEAIEVRVDPTNRLPSGRHGLADAAAKSQWVRWWTGAAADVTRPWCTADKPDGLRDIARPRDASALAEELQLSAVDDIRIVNSAYAGLMDRVARSPGFEIDINAELGAIPLALSTAPASGPSNSFRFEFETCSRIHIEGIHFLGCPAQSGIAIRDSQNFTIRRCWVDLFASGTTPRGGMHAVGRGIQIDGSGGMSSNTAVSIDMCDIGWNHAARRAVAVRAAGIAIHDSNVVLSRCHVHHNVATAAPADVAAQGTSSLHGSENHRDGNRVSMV